MNRSEIKTRILHFANDNAETPVFFSDNQLNTLIDEGLQVLAEDSRAIRRTAMFAMRAGTTFYSPASIADDIMFPYRLFNQGRNTRLVAFSMQELDKHKVKWLSTTGNAEVWYPVSWDLFGIYPSTATAGGIIRMDYIAWPRALIDDTDEPEFPQASQDALVLWGGYLGLLKKWDTENAQIMLKSLEGNLGKANARSGISKISSRVVHRENQPSTPFPSTVIK